MDGENEKTTIRPEDQDRRAEILKLKTAMETDLMQRYFNDSHPSHKDQVEWVEYYSSSNTLTSYFEAALLHSNPTFLLQDQKMYKIFLDDMEKRLYQEKGPIIQRNSKDEYKEAA